MATYGSLRRASARFDRFKVDLSSNELLLSGSRIPIQEQPFQILRLLLEAEGRVVTREQLRTALWPANTFVDFEHGVNTAVKKLRQALQDSAENPRFVETLPRTGYRFLVPVEWTTDAGDRSPSSRVVPIAPSGLAKVPPLAMPHGAEAERGRWRFALLAMGIVLLLATGGYLLWPRSPVEANKLAIVPFTTFPGFEIAPSFSPDGNQIVFSWFGYEKEFQFDLFVKQVGEERAVQLTHHPAVFLVSAWSPNGRSIAFMRQAEPEASGIYLISSLGGAERKLADITPYGGWDPLGVTWSADGKWLAFARAKASPPGGNSPNQHFSIHLVNIETTEVRALPDPSPDCIHTWQPAFSPDGKYLSSVCVLNGGSARMYVQASDGSQARAMEGAKSEEGFAGIAWSADSRSLLYSSDQNLWRVPLAGGKPEKQLFAQDVESLAVARSGDRLAYSQVRHPSSIWQLPLAGPTKAAGPATKIISSSRGDAGPHISPDGKQIAFQSRRSGSPEIWVCTRDGANPVQASSFGGPEPGSPNWSPDSRRIVFDLRDSRNSGLFVVNLDGGPPKRFFTGTLNAASPFWSANGRWIYFNTELPNAIWKVPAEGGAAVRLTGDGEGVAVPSESTDGAHVFYLKTVGQQHQTWSASVEGGDERVVAGMPDGAVGVPAQNSFYFMDGSQRHFSLLHFDVHTRSVQKVADLPGLFLVGGPNLSYDGRTFLFSGIEHSEGDILLVQGFR